MTKQQIVRKVLAELKAKGLLNEKAIKKHIAKKKINEGPVPPKGPALYNGKAMYKTLAKAFIYWIEDNDYTTDVSKEDIRTARKAPGGGIDPELTHLGDNVIAKMLIVAANGIDDVLDEYVEGGSRAIKDFETKMDTSTYEIVLKICEILKRPDLSAAFIAADDMT